MYTNICIILTRENPVVCSLIEHVPDPSDPWNPCETHKRKHVAEDQCTATLPCLWLFCFCCLNALLPPSSMRVLQLLLWNTRFMDAFFYFFSLRQNQLLPVFVLFEYWHIPLTSSVRFLHPTLVISSCCLLSVDALGARPISVYLCVSSTQMPKHIVGGQ